jgi:phytanoyl-CoA hydroxylase
MKNDHSKIKNGTLTDKNVTFYHDQGYLIANQLLTLDEIETLIQETLEIFRGYRGAIEGIVNMAENTTAEEVLKSYIAIHFPHKISEVILNFVKHKKIAEILSSIISPNVKCMQSMLFVKAPGKQGQSWHQDEFYIPTRDRSLTGVWIALDDATIDNGCLWVIPGSQKEGYIRKRIPNKNDEYSDSDICDLTPYSEKKDAITVEVKKGDVVFFNGYLLHSSLKNKTKNRFRRALVNHYMSAESFLPWDWDGNLSLKEYMRDIIMVAGNDPYPEKGIEDLTRHILRYKREKVKRP